MGRNSDLAEVEDPSEHEFCKVEDEPFEVEPCDDPVPEEEPSEEEPFEVEPCSEDDMLDNVGDSEEEPFEVEPCSDDDMLDNEGASEEVPFEVEPCDGAAVPENEDASEEEPFEVEPCDDEEIGEEESFHGELCLNPVPDDSGAGEEQLYEVEPCDHLMAKEKESVRKSHNEQPFMEERNKQELNEALEKENSKTHKEVLASDERKKKPRKERLSVKFSTDVYCYTYSTESFAAAKLEKRRAQLDDQDKHRCKRQQSDKAKLASHLASPVPTLLDKYVGPPENSKSSGQQQWTGWRKLDVTLKSRSNQQNNLLEESGNRRLSSFTVSPDPMSASQQKHSMEVPSEPQDVGKPPKELDMTNLYVCNLPPSVTSHKLIELFLPYGRIVKSRVVDDYFTGLSKGYGFVKYADPHCASEAIKGMNGHLVEGRVLEVRVAGIPPSGSNLSTHAVSQADSQPSKEIDMTNLYVCNLALSMNAEKLLELFLPYGKVTRATVARDQDTGLCKGYGFVKYSNSQYAAEAVVQLNGRLVDTRKIEVRVAGLSPLSFNSATEILPNTNSRPFKEVDMSNLYVCNIPPSVNTKKLVELFLPFGKVIHARVATDEATESCNGYGFLKFDDCQSASEAIALMNGALIDGETLVVRVAGLSPSAPSSAVHDSPHPVTKPSPETNNARLYITNVPLSMTADKLVDLFLPFGQINKVLMAPDYSFVWYANVHCATKAIEHMDGYLIEGKRLVVKGSDLCPTNADRHALPQSGGKPVKEVDMANLYVGRVPATMTPDQLVELFLPFGHIVQARKFHGYGMIRYTNPSSAANAIDHMNGYQIGGSTLAVKIAGLFAPASDAAANAPPPQMATSDQRTIDITNLYVCHLPLSVTSEKLVELFLPCGPITRAKVVADRVTGMSKGFGFVNFADPYSAAVAITYMNGYPLEGHILEVRIAGVHPSAMGSYMAHIYSYFTCADPSAVAIGIPTSYWPYDYPVGGYSIPAGYQGHCTDMSSVASDPGQTSYLEGLQGPESVSSAEKDGSSLSNRVAEPSQSVGWAGPPGFEPPAVTKKDTPPLNPSNACSKIHLARSDGSQETLPIA